MPKNISAEALYNACAAGDVAAVSRLLPAGGTPRNLSGQRFQFHTEKSCTPLTAAAANGHTEIVRMILERAPNTSVDYVETDGDTALIMAALYHHADIVRLLTDRGGNVNVASQARLITPLRAAVGPTNPTASRRNPDPDGARQLATVRALLRLGAGTLPPPPPSLPDPAALTQPC